MFSPCASTTSRHASRCTSGSKEVSGRAWDSVRGKMLPIGNKPATESQARPLAKLPAEEQAPAWEEANEAAQAESREVTAKDVEKAVSRRTSKPTTPEEEEAAAQNGGRSTGFPWPLPPPRCTRHRQPTRKRTRQPFTAAAKSGRKLRWLGGAPPLAPTHAACGVGSLPTPARRCSERVRTFSSYPHRRPSSLRSSEDSPPRGARRLHINTREPPRWARRLASHSAHGGPRAPRTRLRTGGAAADCSGSICGRSPTFALPA